MERQCVDRRIDRILVGGTGRLLHYRPPTYQGASRPTGGLYPPSGGGGRVARRVDLHLDGVLRDLGDDARILDRHHRGRGACGDVCLVLVVLGRGAPGRLF